MTYQDGFVVYKGWICCFKRMMRRHNTLNCAVQYLIYLPHEDRIYDSNHDPKSSTWDLDLLFDLPDDIQELYQSYLAEKELLQL